MTILARDNLLGHVKSAGRLSEETPIEKLLDEVTVLLAGAAAERLILGRCSHLGARSDYANAVQRPVKSHNSGAHGTFDLVLVWKPGAKR